MNLPPLTIDWLRTQIVGIDSLIDTPFGRRLLVYCDYTASGRCLLFIERYLIGLQKMYANTHTEDDITGRSMTCLLQEAEESIKMAVNAGSSGRLVAIGTGATGAIDRLQQIVGVAMPPATRAAYAQQLTRFLGVPRVAEFQQFQHNSQPVVFVGPYEHHSNEVSWREGLATVIEVQLSADGGIDLVHLEALLRDPAYQGRMRIGSFSAASNVTGLRSPVTEIAELLHRHDAVACFDYAASGPYVEIDMNPPRGPNGEDRSIDALFLSPHKFLGGPGSSGLLVFNERLYQANLAPTIAGGGTVDYVSPVGQDFVEDIEAREQAGTPGVLQTLKAALAFEVKAAISPPCIEAREDELIRRAFERWRSNDRIEILGDPDPGRRIGIVSFNLRGADNLYLHPKFVTALLNDLFGIQSRAGCSCAGPYGHRLLDIDEATSERYRAWVRRGYHGIKPGWCRVCFHYVMDDLEADYVIEAVNFVANEGQRFLSQYGFDVRTGIWTHSRQRESRQAFSLLAALEGNGRIDTALSPDVRARMYTDYLRAASEMADQLPTMTERYMSEMLEQFGDLKFFCT